MAVDTPSAQLILLPPDTEGAFWFNLDPRRAPIATPSITLMTRRVPDCACSKIGRLFNETPLQLRASISSIPVRHLISFSLPFQPLEDAGASSFDACLVRCKAA
mmetsp:Transcript_25546/g.63213  ORF Transcript_25546/g.63213 Transcript_25546/m.63213 type:complete len:104 (-) Transcript_25546:814-1125(-)